MREHDFLDLEYLSAKLDEWLLETALMTAEAKFDLFALEFLKANFNPNQPRVPAGNPTGGQWTSDLGGIAKEYGWGNAELLEEHFDKHGKDFNSGSAREYAKRAKDFYEKGFKNKLPMFQDKYGNIRIYDPKTNTFGSYNPNGTPRTLYKPTQGIKYFENQIKIHTNSGGKIINPLPSKPTGGNNNGGRGGNRGGSRGGSGGSRGGGGGRGGVGGGIGGGGGGIVDPKIYRQPNF
jgi:hypothetical protein